MRAKRLITVAVAAILLIGGVAAVGAASPADQVNENATDSDEQNAPDDVDDADRANEARTGYADGVGPNDGLPEQVPDHVSAIHEAIESFLHGSIDNLGQVLSGLLGDSEAANENTNSANNGYADT